MESNLVAKNVKAGTPVKDPHGSQSKIQEISKFSENSNPNISCSSPAKSTSSPVIKSAKSQKSASKNSNPRPNPVVYSPRNKIRERKFVVARKNSKKEKAGSVSNVDCRCAERSGGNVKKCLCVAYETLRASQEEFFKNRSGSQENSESDAAAMKTCDRADGEIEEEIEKSFFAQLDNGDGYELDDQDPGEIEPAGGRISSTIKRRREKLLEEARTSVPESGKVMHLVKAFERLLSIPISKETDEKEEKKIEEKNTTIKKATKWALPGLQPPKFHESETQVSSCSSFSPSDLFLTAENLGLDSRASVSSSWDSSHGSVSSRSSNGARRSRRNSSESCGTMGGKRWKKKQLKVTCQKPFKLRTEQRGRVKEEEFMKKTQEMMMEEERLRIPIAQGLPWTTDEPECLIKPPVKENTKPLDLKLHTDMRAEERAEFDSQHN